MQLALSPLPCVAVTCTCTCTCALVRACACAPSSPLREFCGALHCSLSEHLQWDIMPPGLHHSRSAPFRCHWHTGCTQRFSSKRQLHRHLEHDHGLRRDPERGWRSTGIGARTRRRETRERRPQSPRSPQERGVIAMLNSAPYSPHIASRVSFAPGPATEAGSSRGLDSAPGPYRGSLRSGAQPVSGDGCDAATGVTPAGASAAKPPLSSAPAVMPPSGQSGFGPGGLTSAERPPAVVGAAPRLKCRQPHRPTGRQSPLALRALV